VYNAVVLGSVAHRAEVRHFEGAQVLVLAFDRAWRDDAELESAAREGVARAPEAVAAVLDASGFDASRCSFPYSLRSVLAPSTWVWAVSPAAARSVGKRLAKRWEVAPADWVFSSFDRALAEVCRRWTARQYELHGADGAGAERGRWETRGFVERLRPNARGTALELLWVGRRTIETTERTLRGAVVARTLWPLPDAAGAPNDACMMHAHLTYAASRLTAIDFDPTLTGQPRDPSWLATLSGFPDLEVLGLGRTDATDEDVEAALEACPRLSTLHLDHTKVTVRTLSRLLRYPSLRWLRLLGCPLPWAKVQEFGSLRGDVRVQSDGFLGLL
jgi:hypothetical protein